MPLTPEDIRAIVDHTRVVRSPKQLLATFGATVLEYFVVTEPSYADLAIGGDAEESVVRSGKVKAAQPQIVTPFYLMNLFQGFEHGQEFAQYLRATFGPNAPGLMYSYTQEPGDMEVVSDAPRVVAGRIAERLDRDNIPLAVVITGVDQFWDVSLAHFHPCPHGGFRHWPCCRDGSARPVQSRPQRHPLRCPPAHREPLLRRRLRQRRGQRAQNRARSVGCLQ